MTYIKLFVDYLDAIEPLVDAERGRLFTALLQYARTGEAPQLNGNERFLFPMLRAQIDRDEAEKSDISEVRSAAGKNGAQAKQAKQANAKFAKQNKQMPDLLSKTSKDKQTSSSPAPLSPPLPLPPGTPYPIPPIIPPSPPSSQSSSSSSSTRVREVENDPAFAAVMSAYMDRINPNVSEQLVAEMLGFIRVMGKECCLRAIQIAQDERKTQWSYVRGILRAKQAHGVRCLADWDKIDDDRERRKKSGGHSGDGGDQNPGTRLPGIYL